VEKEKPSVTGDTIFDHIERIVELSQKKGMEAEFFNEAAGSLELVGAILHITPVQTLLFSHILAEKNDRPVSPAEIGTALNCGRIKLLRYDADFDILREKKLIRCSAKNARRDGDGMEHRTYFVPREVIKALRSGVEYEPVRHKNISAEEFFELVEDLFSEKRQGGVNQAELTFELHELARQNPCLGISAALIRLRLTSLDLLLLIFMCYDAVITGGAVPVTFSDLSYLYDSRTDYHSVKRSLMDGSNVLLRHNLIQGANENGFAGRDSFELTEKTKNEFLGDMVLDIPEEKQKNGIKFCASIIPKQLFYNPPEGGKIKRLGEFLREENFQKIRERLRENKMRTGFACLLSGEPGTGKTETVYQLARESGRDIMEVSLADTKSMWFGESEKKVKLIFDRYQELVKKRRQSGGKKIAPILFFNEADGILSRRRELNETSRSVDQTMNTIQNILLEGIERLEGILIATTNMAVNLDPAFERRFLYKIEFGKPGVEERAAIWRSMLPPLSPAAAGELAAGFELSGGQIENAARKYAVESVLSGAGPDSELLTVFCREEQEGYNLHAGVIGFRPS
jgi:hypothetical protein